MEDAVRQLTEAAQAAAQAAQAAVQVAHTQTQQFGAFAQQQAQQQAARRPGIDGRAIEKPKRFQFSTVDQEDREFPEWRFAFQSWLGVQDPLYIGELASQEIANV